MPDVQEFLAWIRIRSHLFSYALGFMNQLALAWDWRFRDFR